MSADAMRFEQNRAGANDTRSIALRLEQNDIVVFDTAPFALPKDADREFLYAQHLGGRNHKNISFNPHTNTVSGHRHCSTQEDERLCRLMSDFSTNATTWLKQVLPEYAASCHPDRASLHPEEEAIRKLRLSARNDLLHIDAFPTRPSLGRRILRLYANIHHTDARIWVTTNSFGELLQQYGDAVGYPANDPSRWIHKIRQGLSKLLSGGLRQRSVYDQFMLRFHNFLKADHYFQERCPKKFWTFPPGSVWLVFTDSVCHAVLRGQHALEHSYFIDHEALQLPDESPAALLEKRSGMPVFPRRAA